MFNLNNQTAEKELIWFFCHSDGDCGIKSNYNSMVNLALYGPSMDYHDPFDTRTLKYVALRRKIEDTMSKLPKSTYKILYMSFADLKFDNYVVNLFKNLSGVVYLIEGFDIERLALRFALNQNITHKDKLHLSELRIEARQKYNLSLNQYCKIRNHNEK